MVLCLKSLYAFIAKTKIKIGKKIAIIFSIFATII